ncbi:phage terminase large subunit family protein [Escherichia coli]|nr:phage terminase large subunit family protein [Escherichia coli]EGF7405604.1 phage terminase large subunit family protein [Escherichia coli]HBB1429846.1 phage terminase large subunit family protein [Escherichia coli]HBB1658420.1 phage terminase large subunit family protein [Escherichia coli]
MNISNSQVNRLRHFVRAGLRSLFRPEPQTAVEWADANYYLPKESAYQEGRWETLPFQRAIMNAMGSDYIREVNVVKSARVGYSKMLLGVYAYFIEHKQRNTLIWLPTDGDAENFMKTHVEPTIRDIPSLLALAPWYGKKHRDNTLTMKRFSNGRGFWCLGGKAAKNYREKSVDVAGYDELAAFDEDIEQEGSPTFLGDKRIEGSVWPKSIRGSTPKVRGTCQIERAASESPHFMRFHVACPHCGEEQYLKFGDKETPFGLKWTPDDPSSVFYLCEHNACVIRQQELDFTDARYICEKTGIWTRDGILWFSSSGEEIEPPDSVTFHIWTAYSPFTTWVQIVKDWMKTKGDTGKRKTFVNTTLGETWEAKIGERPDAEVMAERKEHYSAPVPDRVAYLTAGIDSQLDRYEMRVWGWGPGEESWLIDRQIIMGRHDDEQTLLRVDEAINKTYTRRNGAEMSVSRICWDTGGIDPTIVYERSKKHGLFRVIPIKGVCAETTTEDCDKTMKHTEIRAAVLDALEKHDTGATLFDGRPAVFDEADFPAVAVYLTGAEYTGEELDSDTWQAALHIEVFLPAQVPDSELDAWMESRIYPVMNDIPALSDLITSMVASGYDYRRDDDAGLWSSADLTYVITYEM